MRHSRDKKVKWTQALGVWHEMLRATSSQGTALQSPSFLLRHSRFEPRPNQAASSDPGQGSQGLPWSRLGAFCPPWLYCWLGIKSSPDKKMLLPSAQCQGLAGHQHPREHNCHANCSLSSTQAPLCSHQLA